MNVTGRLSLGTVNSNSNDINELLDRLDANAYNMTDDFPEAQGDLQHAQGLRQG